MSWMTKNQQEMMKPRFCVLGNQEPVRIDTRASMRSRANGLYVDVDEMCLVGERCFLFNEESRRRHQFSERQAVVLLGP